MALGISASHHAFRSAVGELGSAAARLRADRDRAVRQVETLLDGGWGGPAATAYAAGWEEWAAGAGRVLDGLLAMQRLLAAADVDLTATDAGAEASLARLAARLG